MGLGIGTRLVDGCEGCCSGTLSRDTRRQQGQQEGRNRQELAKALGGL